jgi:hypothetical protein
MELSPNYAGTLRGFTNTFGNMTGFVAPLFAGSITNQNVRKNPYFKCKYSQLDFIEFNKQKIFIWLV